MYFHYPMLLKVLRLTCSRRHCALPHCLFVPLLLLPFLLLRTAVLCFRQLDRIFFPAYRNQPVTAPVFIVGNPRSGTTFTHRLMARDRRFVYLKLYHTIFPSIVLYRLFGLVDRIDRRLGRPALRLVSLISNRGFRGWETIHRTGPEEAESDEMFFVYAMLSPLLGLLFPFVSELEEAAFPDRLPEPDRRRLMRYFRDCLQRHLYAAGPDKILLEKVALIAGRLRSVAAALPDIRIVHLVRHPYESVPSLVNMFYAPWKVLAPHVKKNSDEARSVARMVFGFYRELLEIKRELPPERFMEVRYEDLVADPAAAIERIYERFSLPLSDEYREVIRAEAARARTYKSRHAYSLEEFGLTKDTVYEELQEVFEAYGFER